MSLFSDMRRHYVRNRIIARNANIWVLRGVLFMQTFCMVAMVVSIIASFIGFASPFWIIVYLGGIMFFTGLYLHLWLRMIKRMQGGKDEIFIRTLLRDGGW